MPSDKDQINVQQPIINSEWIFRSKKTMSFWRRLSRKSRNQINAIWTELNNTRHNKEKSSIRKEQKPFARRGYSALKLPSRPIALGTCTKIARGVAERRIIYKDKRFFLLWLRSDLDFLLCIKNSDPFFNIY